MPNAAAAAEPPSRRGSDQRGGLLPHADLDNTIGVNILSSEAAAEVLDEARHVAQVASHLRQQAERATTEAQEARRHAREIRALSHHLRQARIPTEDQPRPA